jgi:hypothetical protein
LKSLSFLGVTFCTSGTRTPERIRLAWFYCVPRQGEVADGLVELLIQVTHRITVKAERRVVEELVEEAREVRGKASFAGQSAQGTISGRVRGIHIEGGINGVGCVYAFAGNRM